MFWNDFYQPDTDKRVRWYLANRKVILHLLNPVFDCKISIQFKSCDLRFLATPRTTVGSLQRSTIADQHGFAFCIDFLIALAYVGIAIFQIVWGSTWGADLIVCIRTKLSRFWRLLRQLYMFEKSPINLSEDTVEAVLGQSAQASETPKLVAAAPQAKLLWSAIYIEGTATD